jgi:hypothetical protein
LVFSDDALNSPIGACISPAIAPNSPADRRRIVETALRLLMSDGVLDVQFRPRLTSEQYTELMLVIERPETKDQLRQELEGLAEHWGNEIEIDG